MNAQVPLSQLTADADDSQSIAPILQPYLLVLFGVPFYIDGSGRRWVDALWAKDLVEHTRYIGSLTLAAPAVQGALPANVVAVDEVAALRGIVCVDLPKPHSILSALLSLPKTCAILWRELKRNSIVHTGVAGWPLPEAWMLLPLLRLLPRPLYINVESAFWRLVPGEPASWRRRVRAAVTERLNRACIERSEISTFTHDGYRRSLLRRHPERGHVVEASWIDQDNVLDDAQLKRVIEQRRGRAQLRLVFVGRLTREKGLLVLLDAVVAALRDKVAVELDIFGEGPLRDECAERIRALGEFAPVRLRGTMPYDQRFFEAMCEYDALVVPSISDEQPRIVFDAYAQGLPVIASRTEGLLQCVDDQVTGFLVPAGDHGALSACIERLAAQPMPLAEMAWACVHRARRLTHRQMHRARWQLLVDRFPALTRPA